MSEKVHPFVLHYGERIRKARLERGLTMGQVARLANCYKSTISRLERGLRLPREEQLQRIAKVLNVSLPIIKTRYLVECPNCLTRFNIERER